MTAMTCPMTNAADADRTETEGATSTAVDTPSPSRKATTGRASAPAWVTLASLILALATPIMLSGSARAQQTSSGALYEIADNILQVFPTADITVPLTFPLDDSDDTADDETHLNNRLPYIVYRVYEEDALSDLELFGSVLEGFEDADGEFHYGFGFSTSGWTYLDESKEALLDYLGFSLDELSLDPIGEDTRESCADDAVDYEVTVSGQVYDVDFSLDAAGDSLDIFLAMEFVLGVEYDTWTHYDYSWEDDFWHCATFGGECPKLLDSISCEPSSTCGGTYCPGWDIWVQAAWDYDTNPLEMTFHYTLQEQGVGHMVMAFDETSYHNAWAALIGSVITETGIADDNPFDLFASLFEGLVDGFVQVWVTSGYTVPLPFDLTGTAEANRSEVTMNPYSNGVSGDYIEVRGSIDYEGTTRLRHDLLGEPTLATSSYNRYGIGIPEAMVNDLLYSAWTEGALDSRWQGDSADIADLADVASGFTMSYQIELTESPVADFSSDREPWLLFPRTRVTVKLAGTEVGEITADLEVPLWASMNDQNIIRLTPLWDDAVVILRSTYVSGPLVGTSSADKQTLFLLAAAPLMFDELGLVKQGFWSDQLYFPAEDVGSFLAEDGWLNLYLN